MRDIGPGAARDVGRRAEDLVQFGVQVYMRCMKRTNVVLDDRLVARARKLTGLRTARDVLQRALSELVAREEQRRLALRLRGSGWNGDLDQMRRS
jgi:Arc/MetJ family transcription regulator